MTPPVDGGQILYLHQVTGEQIPCIDGELSVWLVETPAQACGRNELAEKGLCIVNLDAVRVLVGRIFRERSCDDLSLSTDALHPFIDKSHTARLNVENAADQNRERNSVED